MVLRRVVRYRLVPFNRLLISKGCKQCHAFIGPNVVARILNLRPWFFRAFLSPFSDGTIGVLTIGVGDKGYRFPIFQGLAFGRFPSALIGFLFKGRLSVRRVLLLHASGRATFKRKGGFGCGVHRAYVLSNGLVGSLFGL